MNKRVLLVDDDATNRMLMTALLEEIGCVTETAGSLNATRRALEEGEFDLVLLDVHLPDGEGTDLLPEIRRRWPSMPVAVLSGEGVIPQQEAFDLVLAKADSPESLLRRISKVMTSGVRDQ